MLFSGNLPLWPCHRWTGSDEAMDYVGVPLFLRN